MVQIHTEFVINQAKANEFLREFQRNFPKRKIIGISMFPVEVPGGWFMTISYEINM